MSPRGSTMCPPRMARGNFTRKFSSSSLRRSVKSSRGGRSRKASCQLSEVMIFSMSLADSPLAYRPPTTAPMLVPATASTGTRNCSRTFRTPMWAAPRAPPPESTRPMRGRCLAGAPLSTCCAGERPGAASMTAAARRLSTRSADATARVEPTERRIPARAAARVADSQPARGITDNAGMPSSRSVPAVITALLLLLLVTQAAHAQSPEASDWGYYGGDAFGQRFTSLDQINRDNVRRLTLAWSYRTGELGAGLASGGRLTFEATPVLAFGLLYVETATNVVIALDPESGKPRWRFDPHIDRSRLYAQVAARGVSVWEDTAAQRGLCRRRLFTATLDARLVALDADTGQPCPGFGTRGEVDLTSGLMMR